MQITKARLKQIIQEEFSRMNEVNVKLDNTSNKTGMGEISEDGHTDVSSAIRSMKLIIEDASEILEGLMQISKNGELPSWWMNKVAVAKKDLNSCRDYFLVSEEEIKNPGKYKTGMKKGYDKDGDGVPDGADKNPTDGSIQESQSLSGEEFQILYRKLQDVISNSDLSPADKLNIKTILRNSDLKDRFEAELKGTFDQMAKDAKDEMPPMVSSDLPKPETKYDSPYLGGRKSYQESQSPSDDLLEALIRKQLQKKTKISEALSLHIKEGVGIERNIFRPGSDSYFALISEARRQYKNGDYSPINEEELELLESNVGEFGIFEGEKVPLDFPTLMEEKDPPIGKPTKNTESGKKYKVFVRNPKTGKIKKITYGDNKGGLKGNWNNAEARASFAARHNCAEKSKNPNRRMTAGYWACRAHKDFGKNVPGRFW
jgi:hypothetical protein